MKGGDQFYIIVYGFNLDDDFLQLQLYAEYNIEHYLSIRYGRKQAAGYMMIDDKVIPVAALTLSVHYTSSLTIITMV